MFVCLSARLIARLSAHMCQKRHVRSPNFTKFSVVVKCGRGLVLFDDSSSGFVDTSCFHIMGIYRWGGRTCTC